jgi:hypothetical protein
MFEYGVSFDEQKERDMLSEIADHESGPLANQHAFERLFLASWSERIFVEWYAD